MHNAAVVTTKVLDAGSRTVVQRNEERLQQRALRFSGIFMACSLLLQRFGTTANTSVLNSVAPVGLGLAFYALVSGALMVSCRGLFVFVFMCFSVLVGTCVAMLVTSGYGAVSWASAIQFLLLCSFGTLTFSVAVDERSFFRVLNSGICRGGWPARVFFTVRWPQAVQLHRHAARCDFGRA